MDPHPEEADVFEDEPMTLAAAEEEEDEEEEEEEDEEDARIFNAWMQTYSGGERRLRASEGAEDEEAERAESPANRGSAGGFPEPPPPVRRGRRASLPCQLSRLHVSSRAPLTARLLLRRSSSRRLLPLPQEDAAPTPVYAPERRPSLIPAIPEANAAAKRGHFRRRNVMSMSDADSVCLICHNDLNRGSGGITELQCAHTFHKECIEEWLWRKQSCPTCHVQVFMPQPSYWSSTRVKVP